MRRIFLLSILFASCVINAQTDSVISAILEQTHETTLTDSSTIVDKDRPNPVYLIADRTAEYVGGKRAMIDFISNNLSYPKPAISAKIEGKVRLKFIIDSKGKVCCMNYMGQPIGYGLEEEAIRLLKAMPLWSPAIIDEMPVAVYYQLPIMFKYYEE